MKKNILKIIPKELKKLFLLWKEQGFIYAWNYFWFRNLFRRHSLFITKLLLKLAPYPLFIEIETTTRCNLRCIICEHTYWKEPPRDMSFEKFKYIVDQFPHLTWIGLTGIGESFLNPDFMKMLRYMKQRKVLVEIFDTFIFLTPDKSEEVIDLVYRILPSIDAATKETYEKIRVGAKWETVVNNLKSFLKIRRKRKRYFPEVCFHYIVNKYNYKEMELFLEFVREIAGDQPLSVQFTRMLHKFKEVEDLFIEVPPDKIENVNKVAKKLKIELLWNTDVPLIKPPITYCSAWMEPFIFVTGHVIPCCATNEANRRDFQKKYALGNVFEQPFIFIWRGEKYKTLRKKIFKGEIPIQCTNCPIFEVKR